MSRWVAVVGENPLRIVRMASQLRPTEVVALSTPETAHVVPEVRAALAEMGVDTTVVEVVGDAYRWDVTAAALVSHLDGGARDYNWLIAGGTKPMIAAQASVATDVPRGHMWSLDDRAGTLNSWTGERIELLPPTHNISVAALARLHAGLRVSFDAKYAAPASPHDVSAERISARLEAWTGRAPWNPRADPEEVNRVAEADFVALIRGLLPASYDVYGSTTVVLRDPDNPMQPARDPFRAEDPGTGEYEPRTFEVDGVVVRGLHVWALEYKNFKLSPLGLRTHAAELDIRRRHLGGDAAVGVLASTTRSARSDEAGEADVVSPMSPLEFELGRTLHVDRPRLEQAAEAWLNGTGRSCRLAQLFA